MNQSRPLRGPFAVLWMVLTGCTIGAWVLLIFGGEAALYVPLRDGLALGAHSCDWPTTWLCLLWASLVGSTGLGWAAMSFDALAPRWFGVMAWTLAVSLLLILGTNWFTYHPVRAEIFVLAAVTLFVWGVVFVALGARSLRDTLAGRSLRDLGDRIEGAASQRLVVLWAISVVPVVLAIGLFAVAASVGEQRGGSPGATLSQVYLFTALGVGALLLWSPAQLGLLVLFAGPRQFRPATWVALVVVEGLALGAHAWNLLGVGTVAMWLLFATYGGPPNDHLLILLPMFVFVGTVLVEVLRGLAQAMVWSVGGAWSALMMTMRAVLAAPGEVLHALWTTSVLQSWLIGASAGIYALCWSALFALDLYRDIGNGVPAIAALMAVLCAGPLTLLVFAWRTELSDQLQAMTSTTD